MSFYTDSYGRKHYIRNDFKRFHSMNAQCAYYRAYEGDRYFDRYFFISYSSPICYAMYDSKYDSWHINVNPEKFDCSPSTSRQFNRWLSENNIPCTLYDCKEAYKHEGMSYDLPENENVTIFWKSEATLLRYM